jgi:hypothetical protein
MITALSRLLFSIKAPVKEVVAVLSFQHYPGSQSLPVAVSVSVSMSVSLDSGLAEAASARSLRLVSLPVSVYPVHGREEYLVISVAFLVLRFRQR